MIIRMTWLLPALFLLLHAQGRADEPPVLPPDRLRGWQTGMLAPDRLQHGSLSLTLGLGAGVGGASPAAAFGAVFTLGLAKEIHDRRHKRFDPLDLAADAAGAGLAALLIGRLGR